MKRYNNFDNPSSSMRINKKQLKHLLMLTEYVIFKTDTPVHIKAVAIELKERTDKYCNGHYNKVFEEINNLENTNIERFMK